MATYAVIARIGRVDPHLAPRDIEAAVEDDPTIPAQDLHDDRTTVAADLLEGAMVDPLGDRLARLRECWAQTTFFLFDAQSWRT